MKQYTIHLIDAFTKEKFKGNPAGIVEVIVPIQNKKPSLVKIGGEAITIFKTFIEL